MSKKTDGVTLPEIKIRLEVDGVVVQEEHLVPPYTESERRKVVAGMMEKAQGLLFIQASIVFCPIIEFTDEELAAPIKKENPKVKVIKRTGSKLEKFVRNNLLLCGPMYAMYSDGKSAGKLSTTNALGLKLVASARVAVGYSENTPNRSVFESVMLKYRQLTKLENAQQ